MRKTGKSKALLLKEILQLQKRVAELEYETETGADSRKADPLEAEGIHRKEFLDTVVDSMPGAFFVVDAGGKLVLWNSNYERVFGYSKEELSTLNALATVPEQDSEVILDTAVKAFTEGSATAEIKGVTKGGESIPAQIMLKRTVIGGTIYLLGIALDLRERKRAEEALRKSEEESRRLSREHSIMAEIARIIGSTLEIEDVYERFANEARKLISFDRITINLVDRENDLVTFPYTSGIVINGGRKGDTLRFTGSLTERVVLTRSTMVLELEEMGQCTVTSPLALLNYQAGIRTIMQVPLISKDQAIGTVYFASFKSKAYSGHDLSIARSIASQIAGAIANAQLFAQDKQAEQEIRRLNEELEERVKERTEQLRSINETLQAELDYHEQADRLLEIQYTLALGLNGITSLDEGLRLCLDAALQLSGMDCGGIYLVRQPSGSVDLAIHRGLSLPFVHGCSHYEPDTLNARLVAAGKPMYTSYPKLIPALSRIEKDENLRALAVLPLFHESTVVGCLNVASHNSDEVPVSSRVALEAIAAQIGTSIARLKAEEALRESEQKWITILQGSPTPAFFIDKDHKVVHWNKALEELTGFKSEQMIGTRQHATVFHNDGESCIADKIIDQAMYVENQPQSPEDSLLSAKLDEGAFGVSAFSPKLGATGKWLNMTAAIVKDSKGGLVGVLQTVADVTDERRTREELAASEEKYRTLVENSRDAIFILDHEANFVSCNQGFVDLFGYDRSEIKGKSVRLIHPSNESFERLGDWVRRSVAAMGFLRTEWNVVRKDGTLIPVEMVTSELKISDGSPPYRASIMRDISERKAAEAELKKHRDHLEDLVAQRAERIRELEQQRTEIEKLAATGLMAARVAHEINNPLAGIKNSFQLIKDAIATDHPYYEFVARIDKEIDRIAEIVRQTFMLYRPDEVSEFPIQKTIQDVVALLESAGGQKKVTFEIRGEPIMMEMPEGSLRQVLHNLLTNAIEASPTNGVIIISTEQTDGRLTLSIADQGPGIPEETQSEVFRPFFTTRRGPKAGLGLGLSISKEIVESLQGEIRFYREAGKRTVFQVHLPVCAAKR